MRRERHTDCDLSQTGPATKPSMCLSAVCPQQGPGLWAHAPSPVLTSLSPLGREPMWAGTTAVSSTAVSIPSSQHTLLLNE